MTNSVQVQIDCIHCKEKFPVTVNVEVEIATTKGKQAAPQAATCNFTCPKCHKETPVTIKTS
jgi:hypothetical protein